MTSAINCLRERHCACHEQLSSLIQISFYFYLEISFYPQLSSNILK